MLSRRLICLICLVLGLSLAGSVQADQITWTDGTGDHLWRTPGNWDTGNLPTAADWAKVRNGGSVTIVNEGALALKVHLGYAGAGATLTVDGGTLTMPGIGNSDLLLGKQGGSGTLNMIDGAITCVDLEVGGGGSGIINMTGGTIHVANDFDIPESSGSAAEVNLDGGTIFVDGDLMMLATGSIDISAGTLIINGNVVSTVHGYINNGWITAYDGSGTLDVDTTTTPGKTTVTAFLSTEPPTKATNPNPASSATDVSIYPTLSWVPGLNASSHDVYFGTDPTPDAGEFRGNQTDGTFNPGVLSHDTVYYWRIDEKNAFGTATGDVWSFTTTATTSGIVIVPTGGDDADLIQTALDGLQNGDTLRLNGDFVIASTIYLPSDFTWILTGSLTLGDNAVLDNVGWVDPPISARRRTGISETPGGATNIDMSGGTYYGNYAGNSSSLRFINFVSVTNSYFHDMVMTDVSDDIFTLAPGCNNNECRNLIGSFSASGNALTDKGDHNTWYDCIAADCGSDGWTPKCRYSTFIRCIASDNDGPGWGMYAREEGYAYDVGAHIIGNQFIDCVSYGSKESSGFSFNISSNCPGAIIRDNFIQAVCYDNQKSGVSFRNKDDAETGIIEDNVVDIVCYGNKGLRKDGSPSTWAGGLGMENDNSSTHNIIENITGSVVCYDNRVDVNTKGGHNCNITAYHPEGENDPILEDNSSYNNTVTVIDFNCSDPLVEWCMQAYCEMFVCAGLADLNCDGIVDIYDLSYMAGVWLADNSKADIAQPANNRVDLLDFSILSLEWLQ